MDYTHNQELEKLKKEKEENEKKVEQLDHRIQRLENRIKYYQDGERKRRTHRLCTIAGTVNSGRTATLARRFSHGVTGF